MPHQDGDADASFSFSDSHENNHRDDGSREENQEDFNEFKNDNPANLNKGDNPIARADNICHLYVAMMCKENLKTSHPRFQDYDTTTNLSEMWKRKTQINFRIW